MIVFLGLCLYVGVAGFFTAMLLFEKPFDHWALNMLRGLCWPIALVWCMYHDLKMLVKKHGS